MLLFAPSFGRILLTPHLFVTVPSSYRRGCLRSLFLSFSIPPFSLFLFIPLAQHPRSRAILRNASPLSPVLPFLVTRISFPLPRRLSLASSCDSILPHPRPPCVDLSPLPLADELRGNEREQGRSNRPSTETTFLSPPPFVFRRASASSSLPILIFIVLPLFLRSPGKLYNAKCHPYVALFGSLFLYLSFYLPLFLSLSSSWLRAGPLFFRLPLVLASSFAHCSSPAAAFRARFIPTRPCGNVSSTAILDFFPSGFFSPPQTFLACLISGLFFSRRKSRVKIAVLYALNTAACDQYRITRVTLSRDRPQT